MARSNNKTKTPASTAKADAPAPPAPSRVTKKGITLPPRVSRPGKSIGVTGGLRPAATRGKRTMTIREAAEMSGSFSRGGEACARWAQLEHSILATERRTAEGWDPLITEFAARPINGFRRGRK